MDKQDDFNDLFQANYHKTNGVDKTVETTSKENLHSLPKKEEDKKISKKQKLIFIIVAILLLLLVL